jgi:hypothetical protein
MKLGTLKSYILHEEKLNDLDFRIMKTDSPDTLVFQVDKNEKTIVRQKIASTERGKEIIARMYSDVPKAFDDLQRPPENEGGGGLLEHMQEDPPKKRKKKKWNKRRKENWESPDGRDQGKDYYSRSKVEFSRDDESNRNQDDLEGHGKSYEGTRPNIPEGEDSIDVANRPQEYKVDWDDNVVKNYENRSIIDVKDKQNKKLHIRKMKEEREHSLEDSYTVKTPDGRVIKKKVPYNRAVELNRKHPNSVIEKSKRRMTNE